MRACASVSGGVLFIPEALERTILRVIKRMSNDNKENKTKP